MENNDYRNITLSTKVCARQKAEYVKIAAQNGISMSEWLACIIESNKNKYGKEGDPTKRELNLEKEIDTVKAFHSAKAQHGGTGATYVLLKNHRTY